MGLFGGLGKSLGGLFGEGSMDRFARAQALIAGDYGAAAQLTGAMSKRRKEQEDEEAQAEQLRQLHATIDADPALSPQDKAYAKANPKAYIENYLQRFKPFDSGPQGGSRGLPGQGGRIQDWQMAPRIDSDGNEFGPGTGMAPAPIIRRGTKTMVIPEGGSIGAVDAISGQELGAGEVRARSGFGPPPSVPRIGQVPMPPGPMGNRPVPVRTQQQLDALPPGTEFIGPDGKVRVKTGGPMPSASGRFPGPY